MWFSQNVLAKSVSFWDLRETFALFNERILMIGNIFRELFFICWFLWHGMIVPYNSSSSTGVKLVASGHSPTQSS